MGNANHQLKIGISSGDLNGIGMEVLIKTLLDQRMFELCTPVLYASKAYSSAYRKSLGIKDFSFVPTDSAEKANPKRANVIDVWDEDFEVEPGKATPKSGALALRSLQAATADLKEGKIDILLTLPIDKGNIQSEEFQFPGHTEFLATTFESEEFAMLMVSDHLKITFMTGHLPLADVGKHLAFESIIKKIRFLDGQLVKDFGIRKPKIAVLGLNPHNGDGGILGSEEEEFIAPAIKKAKEDGILVFGPFAADGFFGSGAYHQFDVVLAMYHDQGLIPFKTLNFDRGVNFTSGLPVVRVSPDHGTAFDIAGKGIASENSCRDAFFCGMDIFREHQRYADYTADVLQPQKERRGGGKGDRSSDRRNQPRKPKRDDRSEKENN